jgi:hypothetical protein
MLYKKRYNEKPYDPSQNFDQQSKHSDSHSRHSKENYSDRKEHKKYHRGGKRHYEREDNDKYDEEDKRHNNYLMFRHRDHREYREKINFKEDEDGSNRVYYKGQRNDYNKDNDNRGKYRKYNKKEEDIDGHNLAKNPSYHKGNHHYRGEKRNNDEGQSNHKRDMH